MPNFRIVSAFLALFVIAISCKKEEDQVEPVSCKYLGKSYKISYPSGSGEEHGSEVLIDENGLLKEANTTYINSFTDVSTNTENSRGTDQRKYSFTYDGEGFVKQMIMTKSYVVKTKSSFYYGSSGPFKDFSLVTVETTDFNYDAGKVSSMSIKNVKTQVGDKQSPVETTIQSTRTYQYGPDGKPLNFTETFDNGDKSINTYKNGVRASKVFTTSSGYKQTTNYNEMGLVSEDITSLATFKLSYDAKGNMTGIEAIINNTPNYKQEYVYDDKPNPETLIPSEFKGIPDPILTIQSSDGKRTNNMVEEKFISYINNPGYSQKYLHTYNASGYPETTTISTDSGQGIISRVTTYKYQDCP